MAADPDQAAPKVVDIFVESLRQTLRAVDLAFALAITAAAIVLAWGAQGDFERNIRTKVQANKTPEAVQAAPSSPTASTLLSNEPQRLEVEVPVLNFKADLSTAAAVGLVCFFVFTIRAGNHLRRASNIAVRLAKLDARILDALLTTPSVATATRASQAALSAVLGLLAYAGYVLYVQPLHAVVGEPVRRTVVGGWFMILPIVYLGWQLVTWRNAALTARDAS